MQTTIDKPTKPCTIPPKRDSSRSCNSHDAQAFHGEDREYRYCQSERALWRAVIVQALMDAACGSKKPEALQAKQEAEIWLRGNSLDFMTVCHHAGFEPRYLQKMIRTALERNCQWRALPGQGSRRKEHLEYTKTQANQRR